MKKKIRKQYADSNPIEKVNTIKPRRPEPVQDSKETSSSDVIKFLELNDLHRHCKCGKMGTKNEKY